MPGEGPCGAGSRAIGRRAQRRCAGRSAGAHGAWGRREADGGMPEAEDVTGADVRAPPVTFTLQDRN